MKISDPASLLLLWGAFKKLVVADLLAPAVNTVYEKPMRFSGPILIVATFFFAIQIYCDFSGYTDIAIGVARMLGYRLMINFRQPYFARSVGEFSWHRWHISLSTWFRDYVYIPLGGNRVLKPRHYLNLLAVFLLSGLWHGANWTFVILGALHALYVIGGSLTRTSRDWVKYTCGINQSGRGWSAFQMVTTFALVAFAWIFFRANSVADGLYIVSHILIWRSFDFTDIFLLGLPRFEVVFAFFVIAVVAMTEWFLAQKTRIVLNLWSARAFRWACYYACLFGIIFFGVFGHVEFIYFQFWWYSSRTGQRY